MSKKTDELRERFNAADDQVKALAQEMRALPAKLAEAARTDARQRAKAARVGGDVGTATVSEVQALRERRGALPLVLWGARLNRLQAALDLYRTELHDVIRLRDKARTEREEAEAEYQRAKAAWEEAVSQHSGRAARQQDLQRQLKSTERELAQLEAQGPPSSL